MADITLMKEVYDFLLQLNKENVNLPPVLSLTATKLKEAIRPNVQHLLTSEEEYVDPGSISEGGRSDNSSVANSSPKIDSLKEDGEIASCSVSSLTAATKIGWLEKKRPDSAKNRLASIVNAYQKRYCVIQDGIFYYFDNEQSKSHRGAFYLKEYEARPDPRQAKDANRKDSTFSLVCLGNRSYTFMASDFATMKSWIEAVAANSRVKHELDSIVPSVSENSLSPPSTDEGGELYDQATPEPATISTPKIPTYKPRVPEEDTYDTATDAQGSQSSGSQGRALPAKPTFKVATPTKPNEPKEEETYDDATAAAEEETYDAVGVEEPTPTKAPPPKRILPPRPDEQPAPRIVTVHPNDYGNIFYGLWDCSASQPHELSFKSGDLIHIIDREFSEKGWLTGYLGGKVGVVPKSFLTAAYAAA